MTTASPPLPTVKKTVRAQQQIPTVMRQGRLAPWIYLLPAVIVMLIYIVYPAMNTLYLSFRSADSADWATAACAVGEPCWGIFENYRYALTSPIMQRAFLNNLAWIALMVPGTVILGLLIATLANGVRYEALAKSIIFLPMAISFVGAGVIWRFMYAYGSGQVQIGLLNGLLTWFGLQPISWLTEAQLNTIALIVVGIWMWTGFCMTILAAAIKNVPVELMEAARVDGASEIRAFFSVTLPNIMPTVTVVITTMVINVLKIFDIIYVMTGGNYGTEVIANRMYIEQYTAYNTGRASAIAVVLILVIIPVMIFNIRRFSRQEGSR